MMTLSDLVLLKDAGVRIDQDDFDEALAYENTHRDFASCHGCCVPTREQHQPSCPRASILTMPDWYEELQRREATR
jgi:hypothetical protein